MARAPGAGPPGIRLVSDQREAISYCPHGKELAGGTDKEAARSLTYPASHTHDPEIEREVRELAAQGLERARRFGKGRWEEIIRIADLHSAKANEWPPFAAF